MAKYRITAPDGQKYEITAPDDASEDQVMAYARENFGKQQEAPKAEAPKPQRTIGRRALDTVKAPFEAAMSVGSGLVATPLAGIAGMASAALGGADAGGNTVRSVQEGLTYQPRGDEGRRLVDIATYPFRKLEEGTHAAGGAVTDVAGPEAGTAVKVGLDAIPMVVAGGLSRLGGAGRAAQTVTPQPRALPSPATAIPPEVAARVQMGRSLDAPVEYTTAQATRDAPGMRREANLAETPQGAPIRKRLTEQQEAIVENLDILKGATGARAKSPEQVGKVVAGEGGPKEAAGALKLAERKSDLEVGRLYNKARREGEMAATIDLDPILKAVKENPNAEAILTQQLKAMDLVKNNEFGQPMPTHNITLNQLERIRKRAVTEARTTSDGTRRHDAGELIKAIDDGTPESVGGKAYQAARAARKEHALKFEEPKAVAQLVDMKSKTDRVVALEKVWDKTVRGGSIADVELVRNQLLNSPDRMTRDAGRKAWREVVGQTADHFKAAAEKGPDALKRAVDEIGPRKLDILFGPSSAQKVRNIVQVAQETGKLERTRVGSTTVPNALSTQMETLFKVLDKAADHVPGIPNFARGAVGKVRGIAQEGAATRAAQQALRDPLSGQAQANLPRRNRPPSRLSPAIPLSEVGQQPPQ